MCRVGGLKLASTGPQGLSHSILSIRSIQAPLSPACPLCLLPTEVTLGVGQGQLFLEVEEQVGRPPRFHPNPEFFLDCNERAPDPSTPGQLPLLL